MTFAIYIVLFLGFFVAGLNILPDAGALDGGISAAFSTIIGYMKAWNFLLPISELLAAVSLALTFELFVWGWHAFRWITHLLRGSSSGE